MKYDYDLFVIGAGSGGLAASKRAASYGAKVAIAEGDLVGGTCVIRGCVPKKLMVYASKFAHLREDAVAYGWNKVENHLNWQHLIEVVNTEVLRLSQLHIKFLETAGVELYKGFTSFVDPHTLVIKSQDGTHKQVTAEKILIAVGGEAVKPVIPGVEYSITSRQMFLLKEHPKRIAVVGSGYIGVEFAGIMHGLGSQVTQIIRRDWILGGFDDEIRTNIQEGMTKHGIQFLTNTTVEEIVKVPEGLQIKLAGGSQETLTVDQILYATGRLPNLQGLCLEKAGVETSSCAIAVDPYSRTNVHHIFAVGDCTNRVNLTPVAIGEGRAFADTEFGGQNRVFSHENIATAVFSQPEAGTVGLSEAQAQEQYGEDVQVYRTRFRPMYHSITGADEKTMMKLIVDKKTDRVLGAHMVGDYAAEIIQGIAIAVNMGATKKDFDATVGIHPSSAEEFVTLR